MSAKPRAEHLVLDTSCVVPLLCGWHDRHDDVRTAVTRHLRAGRVLALAPHTLVEAFSVLTRLPPPHRLRSRDAYTLLSSNFEKTAVLRTLRSSEYWAFLRQSVEEGVRGGRVYDAAIARTARKLRPCTFLTLNARHFAQFDAPDFTIETP